MLVLLTGAKSPVEMATLTVEDVLRVNGSRCFAVALAAASPFGSLADALLAARRIWRNEVDVPGWLEAFAANPPIGTTSPSISKWSKEEQSVARSTATHSTAQDLSEWNAKYKHKFGFVFLIYATGRTAPEVLAELKRRYANRLIVELEIAAEEELKITELRLAKIFSSQTVAPPTSVISQPDKTSGVAGSDAKRPRDSWGYVYEEPDLSGGVEGIDYIIAYRDDIKEEEHD